MTRLAELGTAISQLERSPLRLDHARAPIELGGALRRRKRRVESRPMLRNGIDLALQCGADRIARHGAEELRATGARPRRLMLSGVASLTPSELRVARLAAEGRSNPNIAATLFVTTKTIESQMGSVFRKLEISRREQLATTLNTRA